MSKSVFLKSFMEEVWNQKQIDKVPDYLSESYTIHLDPGDPYEGKTLDHQAFIQRLQLSFGPFPDIHFNILESIEEESHVAIRWELTGTNLGPIGQLPPTKRKIKVPGMTIYHFEKGLICGHTQIFDRGKVQQQLGF